MTAVDLSVIQLYDLSIKVLPPLEFLVTFFFEKISKYSYNADPDPRHRCAARAGPAGVGLHASCTPVSKVRVRVSQDLNIVEVQK